MDQRAILKQMYKDTVLPMGVYQIKNQVNGKVFLGRNANLNGIFNRHRFQLKMGSHPNKELQKDWKEYGEENFLMEVLEVLEPEEDGTFSEKALKALEAKWLEELQPYGDRGYHKANA